MLPYQDNLGAVVHEPTFRNAAGNAVFKKAKLVTKPGNNAVHSQRAVPEYETQVAVKRAVPRRLPARAQPREGLYESPFTDLTPLGPDGIFTPAQVRDLVARLGTIQSAAMAA